MKNNSYRTRFAPSPTGPLHLGHAYSALVAWNRAKAAGGEFLLRIEDIDQTRARAEWEAAIYDDLTWMGLSWPTPVLHQSTRMPEYRAALKTLWDAGLMYPCTCTRRDIAAALSAPQEGAPLVGPDGFVYPGTCRGTPRGAVMPENSVLRLDMKLALEASGKELFFEERGPVYGAEAHRLNPATMVASIGDVVLSRREIGTSYHLSVVVDDAAQDITEVVRGADLFDATAIHVLLQSLLRLSTPTYYHHELIRDETGKRLAKRDDARALSVYRDQGLTPDAIRRTVGL